MTTANSVITNIASFGAKLRRTVADLNADTAGQPYQNRADYYTLQEHYYANQVYERADAQWAAIKAYYGLPRNLRPIINPAKRAVDWWPGHVYPGAWTMDGLATSNGVPNLIPYDPDTPEELRLAIQQALTWGNWGSDGLVYVRTGAMLGDVFVEIQNDLERRKIYPRLIHPKYVVDLEWDGAGNLTAYRLAIPQWDPDARRGYVWGKRVDKASITTYYDDKERGYDDQPATVPNPWGFVPAVWVQHRNVGGQHGSPAIDGLHAKIDEANGVVSNINDYLMRFMRQKKIVATGSWQSLQKALSDPPAKRGATHDFANPNADRESQGLLPAPADTTVHSLLENLGLGESDSHIVRLIAEIEKDLPEITLSDKLMAMSQVTAPGAIPLVQDVQGKYRESERNYDAGLIKLGQMCVSMGGALARSGAWGPRGQLTRGQAKFLPFDLASFDRGDLDWAITPRDLIPKSFQQKAMEAAAMELVKTPAGLLHLGYTLEQVYGEGNVPAVLPGILAERESAASSTSDLLARAFNAGV